MKERITLSLEIDLLNVIDKEMIRHQINNKSKFIEFVLRQVLYSPEKKLQLLQKSWENAIARQIALSQEKNKLQEYCEARKAAEMKLNDEHTRENEKDALWQHD